MNWSKILFIVMGKTTCVIPNKRPADRIKLTKRSSKVTIFKIVFSHFIITNFNSLYAVINGYVYTQWFHVSLKPISPLFTYYIVLYHIVYIFFFIYIVFSDCN